MTDTHGWILDRHITYLRLFFNTRFLIAVQDFRFVQVSHLVNLVLLNRSNRFRWYFVHSDKVLISLLDCLFVEFFLCKFVPSFVHSLVRLFVRSMDLSFIRLLVRFLCVRSINYSFVFCLFLFCSFIYWFVHAFIHSFVRSFVRLFDRSSIHFFFLCSLVR